MIQTISDKIEYIPQHNEKNVTKPIEFKMEIPLRCRTIKNIQKYLNSSNKEINLENLMKTENLRNSGNGLVDCIENKNFQAEKRFSICEELNILNREKSVELRKIIEFLLSFKYKGLEEVSIFKDQRELFFQRRNHHSSTSTLATLESQSLTSTLDSPKLKFDNYNKGKNSQLKFIQDDNFQLSEYEKLKQEKIALSENLRNEIELFEKEIKIKNESIKEQIKLKNLENLKKLKFENLNSMDNLRSKLQKLRNSLIEKKKIMINKENHLIEITKLQEKTDTRKKILLEKIQLLSKTNFQQNNNIDVTCLSNLEVNNFYTSISNNYQSNYKQNDIVNYLKSYSSNSSDQSMDEFFRFCRKNGESSVKKTKNFKKIID